MGQTMAAGPIHMIYDELLTPRPRLTRKPHCPKPQTLFLAAAAGASPAMASLDALRQPPALTADVLEKIFLRVSSPPTSLAPPPPASLSAASSPTPPSSAATAPSTRRFSSASSTPYRPSASNPRRRPPPQRTCRPRSRQRRRLLLRLPPSGQMAELVCLRRPRWPRPLRVQRPS
ncbi:hypothetical protein ACP70R_005640 [Stipagrostis hirtigluma subsp. patula]